MKKNESIKNKLKFALLLVMLSGLPACEEKSDKIEPQPKPIYSLSDYDEETLSAIQESYERGKARYDAKQKEASLAK